MWAATRSEGVLERGPARFFSSLLGPVLFNRRIACLPATWSREGRARWKVARPCPEWRLRREYSALQFSKRHCHRALFRLRLLEALEALEALEDYDRLPVLKARIRHAFAIIAFG